MSKFMISAKLHDLKEKFYKKNILTKYQLNSRSWLIVLMILIGVSGLLYLAQINGLATKGYEIKDLEEKSAELRDKNKKLKLQITDLRSTARLNQAVKELEMVEVARVEYLKANGTSVAINR
ncbi:MAG: hypothetical protein GF365_02370 [Candidatus Buchananbacteria bacterium]|nr:hypothetical protein [Candidatus Buchananbacteria bacterium]